YLSIASLISPTCSLGSFALSELASALSPSPTRFCASPGCGGGIFFGSPRKSDGQSSTYLISIGPVTASGGGFFGSGFCIFSALPPYSGWQASTNIAASAAMTYVPLPMPPTVARRGSQFHCPAQVAINDARGRSARSA